MNIINSPPSPRGQCARGNDRRGAGGRRVSVRCEITYIGRANTCCRAWVFDRSDVERQAVWPASARARVITVGPGGHTLIDTPDDDDDNYDNKPFGGRAGNGADNCPLRTPTGRRIRCGGRGAFVVDVRESLTTLNS